MKFKKMNSQEIFVAVSRLTCFKNPAKKYRRVFFEILTKFLIEPKYNLKQLENLEAQEICTLVEHIFNQSVGGTAGDGRLNEILQQEELCTFKADDYTKALICARLNLFGALGLIGAKKSLPLNVGRLFLLKSGENPLQVRKKGFLYPVSKLILCEGATEYALLPDFARAWGANFNEHGYFVYPCGGKNQVARKFYELYEVLKIPIFVLLDKDAGQTAEQIRPKLRAGDEIFVIQNGEFEDILPHRLIQNALNSHFLGNYKVEIEELQGKLPMAQILHELFKIKGYGEFKKAEFAGILRENIAGAQDLSCEIVQILEKITCQKARPS